MITIIMIIIKIYFPHPILQWLFVVQKKKTIKTNKNVKIYHRYITVNNKNMTTKIVKGLRQQNESEGKKQLRIKLSKNHRKLKLKVVIKNK